MKKMLLGLCAMAIAALPLVAAARSQSAFIGDATFNTDISCFTQSTAIIRNTCATTRSYSIPIIWDTGTPASKTVSVTGTRGAGAVLSCTYFGFGAAGVVTTVAFPAFPSGTSTQAIIVTNVPGGTFGEIACNVGASSAAGLFGVNYLAP